MTIVGSTVCFTGGPCTSRTGALIYLASVLVLLALVLDVLLWDARRTPTPSQAAARANRHATLASTIGVALMLVILTWVVAGVVLYVAPRDGRVLATLPVLGGACLLVAQAVGQLTWPKPTGAHREAELARRSVADLAPPWPHRLVFIWAGLAVVLLVAFGLVADGPRSVTREAGRFTEAIGPYPGWYYGVPLGASLLVLVVATELVLRLITLRPAVSGVSSEWDVQLRRRSAAHVTRGIQLVLAITVSGILVTASWVHQSLGRDWVLPATGGDASEGSLGQQYLGAGLLFAAACVFLAGLAVAVLPLRMGRQKTAAAVDLAVAS